jgi:hypothetical protein
VNDDDTPRSVPEILQQHGTMNFDFVVTSDELRNRHDLKGIRKWLNVRRKKVSQEEQALIWCALFALYGIPDEWSREVRMEWLAGRLAADRFKRCQALLKPHGGGPSKERQKLLAKRKLELRKKYEIYCRKISHVKSDVRRAKLFMDDKKNKKACAAAGLRSPKAFAQAMKESSRATLR